MNIYTVCFFGRRYIERGTEIEKRLDKLLHDLITQKEYLTSWSDGTKNLTCLLLLPLIELSAVTVTATPILHSSSHIWKRSIVTTKRSTLTIRWNRGVCWIVRNSPKVGYPSPQPEYDRPSRPCGMLYTAQKWRSLCNDTLCWETGQEDSEPCRRKLNRHLKRKNRAMPSVHGHGGHSPFFMLWLYQSWISCIIVAPSLKPTL